ncbi:MAG: bifunctional 4-hydroxy-2-oxoglutarate aldolase/2-dehydro-3-deoxy-phosphogluconate aldolase [Thiolinea sp.]
MMAVKELCQQVPVIPVLVVHEREQAVPLAETLVANGLPVLEVTLRTPAALEVIRAMSEVPGAQVGAGTLLTPADVKAAKAAGACFGVSPGATDCLLAAARDEGLPLLPGVSTASEIMYLLEQGVDAMKFFPAEAAGGVAMLKSWHGPLPQAMFCPTGGISERTAASYLALPNVMCVGGSWVTPDAMLKAGDWKGIGALAKATHPLKATA